MGKFMRKQGNLLLRFQNGPQRQSQPKILLAEQPPLLIGSCIVRAYDDTINWLDPKCLAHGIDLGIQRGCSSTRENSGCLLPSAWTDNPAHCEENNACEKRKEIRATIDKQRHARKQENNGDAINPDSYTV